MDPLGRSPISPPALILGKLSMLFCWLFFFGRSVNVETMYDSEETRAIAYSLAGVGCSILLLAFVHLGESVSLGLPREQTELKTNGIYRVTRNPMYVGGFIVCAASCFFSIHPANVLLFVLTFIIHHRIVLKEERFLEERFGQRWLEYRKRVPRYLGRIRR